MVINIDLAQLSELTSLPAGEVAWRVLFWYFGWLPVAVAFIWGAIQLWVYSRQLKWDAKNNQLIVLAIDVPQNNQQSPRAVENLFAYLHGAHKSPNLLEVWWDGWYQLSFSLEIVSIEGYIQFLITTPQQFRNLVETAIYSQYPDAEITEVEDYAQNLPTRFPDKEYDLYGTELLVTNSDAYSIKLYPEFEHQFGPPETNYRDPMASLMDLLSSLKKGEQLWFQMVIKPAGFEWGAKGEKEVRKILGETKTPPGLFSIIKDQLLDIGKGILGETEPAVKKSEPEPLKMMNLKPAQKKKIESIQTKSSKIGFETKMRVVYLAKKDVMNKPKVVNGFFGWLKQFQDTDGNGFKPDQARTATNTAYFRAAERADRRKTKIINNYRYRSNWRGRLPFIMTTDELATMWHFPISEVVKAPLLQQSAARRVEPPMRLPMGETRPTANYEAIFSDDFVLEETKAGSKPAPQSDFLEFLKDEEPAKNDKTKDEPPSNLPFE